MNGTSLASGSTAQLGAYGSGRPVGAETHVNNELAKVWGFFGKGDRGRFGEEVLSWIRGEYMETFPKDPFETVKAETFTVTQPANM